MLGERPLQAGVLKAPTMAEPDKLGRPEAAAGRGPTSGLGPSDLGLSSKPLQGSGTLPGGISSALCSSIPSRSEHSPSHPCPKAQSPCRCALPSVRNSTACVAQASWWGAQASP